MRCSSIVGTILFRINRSYSVYVWHRRDIDRKFFRRRRVFPGFQYGDNLRFPSYCWDLVLSEAVVEHCKQPIVSIVPKIIKLFNKYIIYSKSFVVLQTSNAFPVLFFTEWVDH